VAAGKKSAEVTNKDSTDGSQPTGKTSVSRKKSKAEGSTKKGSSSGSGSDENETKIVADIANNSIIVVATPQEYGKILPVIKQLDIMPLQVLIDATIAQVDLKDELQYGIKWYLSKGNDAIGSSAVTGSNSLVKAFSSAVSVAGVAATGGLSAIYNSGSVKALLTAQASLNNVKIISSPSLMVLNNQEAKINVGDQVPVQTGSTSLPIAGGGTNNATLAQSNQIQYKDTGVTLEVTPRVNSNGMVILDIQQIVSVAKETKTGVTTSPTINKEEIESTVAVKDGETLALGGLIQTTNQNNKSGIPFLHELPLIGPLFGSTDNKDNRQELVILLTPRVVKSKQDARIVTDEFKRKLSNIYYDPTKPRKKGNWWRARDW
jgi:general secretion pathway protein D